MQDWLHWLARLKGIAVEAGAELRLELSSFPRGGLALLTLLGVLLAIWAVVFFYRRHRAELSVGKRFVLVSLRVLALLVALLVLFEPNLVAVKREVRPGQTLLLLDTSQSMAHVDAYRRDDVQSVAQAWRQLGVADPARATRLELAKALLSHDDAALVRELARHNQLHAYGFGAGLDPLPRLADAPPAAESPDATSPPRLDLAKVNPEARHTNPGFAVRAALERSGNAPVGGVVLLTDGRRNLGPQGAEVARLLQQRKVPHVLVVPIGDPSEAQLVTLRRAEVPEKVFQKDPFTISAEVLQQGYPEQDLTVRVSMAPVGETPVPIASKTLRVTPEQPNATLSFDDLSMERAGTFEFSIEVVPPSGEAPSPERHVKRARVQVLDEQIRALLIAGGPSPEFRILRDTLIRDKTIDVSCWLQSADAEFPQDGDTRLEQLPTKREELAKFDVFVLIDPDPRRLTPDFCNMLREQVDKDGAGLWWVAGEKFTLPAARAEAPTKPLIELLPVELDVPTADQTQGLGKAYDATWPWLATPVGLNLPLAEVVDGREASKLAWERLPGFFWSFPLLGAKPAAITVVAHGNPRLRGSNGKEMPMVATQQVGSGRVMFSATDESYRWRGLFRVAYERFWVKGVRYLFEGRLRTGSSRMKVLLGSDKVEIGEVVKVEVDARNERLEPLTDPALTLRTVRENGATGSLTCQAVPGVPGRYEALLRPDATGFLRLEPTDGSPVTLQVVRAAVEAEGPVDLATLNGIAGAEGGKLIRNPAELLAAVRAIPSMSTTDVFRTPHPIWDTWVTVALLLTLLALEWWLRKRFNLL